MVSNIHIEKDERETAMGKKGYLKRKPKQKCPKDHEVFFDESNLYYIRSGARAEIKETPTIKKIRNLLMFSLEADGDPDRVAPKDLAYPISLSNFRRLLAVMREYYGICSEDGNAYCDTPSNRKYLAILALHDRLEDGVDGKAFCAEFQIGRTTFYRYLAIVEDFYFYLRGGAKVIALLDDGRYIGVYPEDLEAYNA